MVQLVISRPFLVLLISVLASPVEGGLFEWMKRPETPPAAAPPPAPELPAGDAPPFEMTVADEKFLAEAKLMDLSPLDSCHYRVVAQLKSTCGSLSEEQLAKLGVVLFNCQAEVEGRRTYPCSEGMTLKACTTDMDADTWNAYHIVSNRARSVCYATRQQHFRRRAELTVNALISTATSQLDAMKELKEGQVELRELTSASLDKLLQGHSTLQAQQGELSEGQEQLESSLRSNLERLGQEKALIVSGQELVAQLIQGITLRMENVSEQLKDQGSEVQDGHRAIIEDLAAVRDRAQDMYHKIDHGMLGFLKYQNETAKYYTDLMSKLERMNGTLGTVLHYLDNMQSRIEERLHVIQGYLGWAGLSLAAMWTCILHTGYFLLCAVLLTFLRCKSFTRAALLLIVPLNAVAEVHQQPALDLKGLTLMLLTLSLGHRFVNELWACSRIQRKPACLPPPSKIIEPEKQNVPRDHRPCPSSSTPQRDEDVDSLLEPEDQLDQDSIMSGDPCIAALSPSHCYPMPENRFVPIMGTHNHSSPRFIGRPSLDHSSPRFIGRPNLDHSSPRFIGCPSLSAAVIEDFSLRNLGEVFDAVSDSRSASPNLSLASNSSVSGRQLCNGITKMGKACKKRALLGQEYCRVHEGGYTSYVNP